MRKHTVRRDNVTLKLQKVGSLVWVTLKERGDKFPTVILLTAEQWQDIKSENWNGGSA